MITEKTEKRTIWTHLRHPNDFIEASLNLKYIRYESTRVIGTTVKSNNIRSIWFQLEVSYIKSTNNRLKKPMALAISNTDKIIATD